MASKLSLETPVVAYTSNFDDLANPFHPHAGKFLISATRQDENEDISIPESLRGELEIIEGLVPVYSVVKTRYLAQIAAQGLLRRKNSVGTMAPIAHESAFFLERPQSLAGFDRTRSIYARTDAPRPEHAEYHDSVLGHFTYLELLVDAREALVTDQQIWDDAQGEYAKSEDYLGRTELTEIIRPFAHRYWHDAVRLVDYLAEPDTRFSNPEVLIPFDVPADQLRIFSPPVQ